jgi:hypothetical protein
MNPDEYNVVIDEAFEVCRMVQAIKHCMMFHQIHADFSVDEVCAKFGVKDVQELAHQTQEKAESVLTKLKEDSTSYKSNGSS